jgi:SAM-dependent methyltransferase
LKSIWDEVLEKLEVHDYMGEIARTADRVKNSGEVFTPSALVVEMLKRLPIDVFAPGLRVLDPACGDGQFLVAAKWVKVLHFRMSEHDAVADIFGVDIMRDNVILCRNRLDGGTIVLGDSLRPERRLADQSDAEHSLMQELFSERDQQISVWNS